MRNRILSILALGVSLVATLPSPAALAYPRPARVEWVSVAATVGEPDSYSHEPKISADGRLIAFQSDSTNLVPNDTNGQTDVFVRDRASGATVRASTTSDGGQGDFNSAAASITPDGRYVAFSSRTTNLIPDDANGTWDVLVKDLHTGYIRSASVASDGTQGNGLSAAPSLGGVGGWVVAFESDATNLVPGDTNGIRDVFVHDPETGATTRVSVAPGGAEPDGRSTQASVSGNGRYVAFQSEATNLVPGDTNGRLDIFVADLETGDIRRIAVAPEGQQPNDVVAAPRLNHDGSVVAFSTVASNLVPGDTNAQEVRFGIGDAFVHDLETGVTERVSVSSAGAEANGGSGVNDISGDGRYVTFASGATNLVPNDTNNAPDLFLHDRLTGVTERVSLNHDGTQPSGGLFGSSRAVVSSDGSVVAFASDHPNIVPGDTGTGFDSDIFARHRGPALGISEIRTTGVEDAIAVDGTATFSGMVAASATDALDDGDERVGAELSAASVILRPEAEDLLIRMGVTRLPGVRGSTLPAPSPVRVIPGVAGAPGVIHGLRFTVGGVAHEVRVMRAGASAVPPGAPLFALYRCEPTCLEVARLAGGYGTTGEEIRASVPLASLGIAGTGSVRELRAFAGLGEAAGGVIHPLDEMELPDAALPAPTVQLGIAPHDAAPEDVAFTHPASISHGSFSGRVPIPGGAGAWKLWARACLGSACQATATSTGG